MSYQSQLNRNLLKVEAIMVFVDCKVLLILFFIATVWRQTYQAEAWQRQMGAAFLPRITAAIENRDIATAQTAVREQIEFVKAGAKDVITARGGQV